VTGVVEEGAVGTARAGAHRLVDGRGTASRMALPRLGRFLASWWLPPAVVGAAAAAILVAYGVSPMDVLSFAAYVMLGLTIPGALLWRAAHGRARSLAEDLAAGTMVGYALEVLCYIPARAVGLPYLVLAWPLATIAVFALTPRLRRFWRGGGRPERMPVWCAWPLAAVVLFLLAWSVGTFYRSIGTTWPQNSSPYFDLPFHLAFAGELKHHSPPVIPWVTGEPAAYHWFVYADMAATSWATGIELETLLYRLLLLPMLTCLTLVVAIAAVRLTGRWWAAPAAAAVTYFSYGPNPYAFSRFTFWDAQSLYSSWLSPTHIFGLAIFAAAVLVLMDLLHGDKRQGTLPSGRVLLWALFVVLVAAVTGAKATFLPLMVAGLVAVLAAEAIIRRRPGRASLLALGITACFMTVSQFLLFAGNDGGARITNLNTAKLFPITAATGLAASPATSTTGVVVVITALALVAWALLWAGAAGLLASRRKLADRRIVLLGGVCAAAIGAAMILSFPGYAQAYFLRGAGPFLALLAVAGLAAVTPVGRRPGLLLAAAAAALTTGWLVVEAVRQVGRSAAPTMATEGRVRWVLLQLALPYLALVGAVVVVGMVLVAARRRFGYLRGVSLLLTLLVAIGMGLPQAWRNVGGSLRTGFSAAWHPTLLADGAPEITRDNIVAARWLRDNSDPDNLVATNAHCRPVRPTGCDNRHFWISAYSERRVLLEGWGYTSTANQISVRTGIAFPFVRYWRPEVLAANDEVFSAPSAPAVKRLHDAYGVRWLFVDSRRTTVSPDLSRFARLRFQSGACAVYEIVD